MKIRVRTPAGVTSQRGRLTYEIAWADEALSAAQAFMVEDPEGLLAVFDAVDALADEPHPESATAWGNTGFLRLRIGRYRVLYEVDKQLLRMDVIHLGRSG